MLIYPWSETFILDTADYADTAPRFRARDALREWADKRKSDVGQDLRIGFVPIVRGRDQPIEMYVFCEPKFWSTWYVDQLGDA